MLVLVIAVVLVAVVHYHPLLPIAEAMWCCICRSDDHASYCVLPRSSSKHHTGHSHTGTDWAVARYATAQLWQCDGVFVSGTLTRGRACTGVQAGLSTSIQPGPCLFYLLIEVHPKRATKAQRGSRTVLFLEPEPLDEACVVNATPRPFYPSGKHPVPNVQETWWASGQVWTGPENLASTGIRSHGPSSS